MSNKRRQQQEHFAGSALSDSNLKQEVQNVVDDSSVNGGKYDINVVTVFYKACFISEICNVLHAIIHKIPVPPIVNQCSTN